MVDKNLRGIKKRYKQDYEKKVQFEPTFAPGDYVFVERPPLTTTPAERLASKNYCKLRPRRLWLYRIISGRPDFLKIDQDGIRNTVRINLVRRTTVRHGAATTAQVRQEEDVHAKNDVSPNCKDKKKVKEYVVDRIIRHGDTPDGRQYFIRWYRYEQKDDTHEPTNTILQHFRDAYLRPVQRQLWERDRNKNTQDYGGQKRRLDTGHHNNNHKKSTTSPSLTEAQATVRIENNSTQFTSR